MSQWEFFKYFIKRSWWVFAFAAVSFFVVWLIGRGDYPPAPPRDSELIDFDDVTGGVDCYETSPVLHSVKPVGPPCPPESEGRAAIEDVMREHGAQRVLAVRVSVGEFSGVDAELFRLAFEELTSETPMRETKLILEQKPLEARCFDCSSEFAIERFRFQCTTCGSGRITIQSGDDLVLHSVTLEQVV